MAILHIRRKPAAAPSGQGTTSGASAQTSTSQPGGRFSVALPVRINQPLGLGDAVKRATSALGIKPCAGCQRRAAALNRLVSFKSR